MGNLSQENKDDIRKYLEEFGSGASLFRGNSTTSQTMTSDVAGQVITIENEIENKNFIYSNGILLFLKDGFYSIDVQLHLNATSGQNAHFESWFEYSVSGQAKSVFPDSGRFIEFRERTEGMVTYSSHLNIVSGTSFELVGRSKTGSVELISSNLDNGTSAPSVVVSVIKL